MDPDRRTGAFGSKLSSSGAVILQAEDARALSIVNERDVRLVVTELYLKTGEDDDLIHAIRRTKALRRTRALAHTLYGTAVDRDWAMRAGADAYLIKPTRAERLRYVVSRLASKGSSPSSLPATSDSPVARRDSLGMALTELEQGALKGTSSIVFGRSWWEELTVPQQAPIESAPTPWSDLRSDSMPRRPFRRSTRSSAIGPGPLTERPESPYRR